MLIGFLIIVCLGVAVWEYAPVREAQQYKMNTGVKFASDGTLLFVTHDLSIDIYSASDLYLVYSGTPHELSVGEMAREKTTEDETRYPGYTSGSYYAFKSGPAEIKWTSRDGVKHEYSLDLDSVFKDRKVLHTEDPNLNYKPEPITGGEPTIIIEVNDRTLNVYMFAAIQTVSPYPSIKQGNERDHRTLAFTKTF